MPPRRLKVLYENSLAPNPAGTGTFTRGLLGALAQAEGVEVVVSRFRSDSVAFLDVSRKSPAQRLRSAVEHLRYFALELPARAQRAGCDVIFSPTGLGPLRGRIPSVITVHDLTLLRYPATVQWVSRAYLRTMLRLQVRRSAAVCTVSQAVARELVAVFPHLAAGRVHVVRDAPDPELLTASATPPRYPPPEGEGKSGPHPEGQGNWGRQPFFLMVGTIEPRKNHLTGVRAFAAYLQRHPQAADMLVIAGSPGWLYQPLLDEIAALRLEPRVRRLGHIDPGQLSWLYQNARALLFPSLYEGFGIPVVEAFALGCPVIAASIAAVVEVAGEGTATLLPPLEVDRWAEAIGRAATSPPDAGMIAAAKRRAAAFTWAASAQALVEALASTR